MKNRSLKLLIPTLTIVLLASVAYAAAGNIHWVTLTGTGGEINSSPTAEKKKVYVGSNDGNVYSFDAGTGEILWATDLGAPIDSSPVVYKGVLYVGADNGRLTAIDTK